MSSVSILSRMTSLVAAALAGQMLLGVTTPAFSIGLHNSVGRDVQIRQNGVTAGQLQTLQNRQMRENFQQQQQQFRQQDRQVQGGQRLRVPVMRPNCTQISGNAVLPNCR